MKTRAVICDDLASFVVVSEGTRPVRALCCASIHTGFTAGSRCIWPQTWNSSIFGPFWNSPGNIEPRTITLNFHLREALQLHPLLKTNKGLINMKNEEQIRINYCFICDLYPWIAWNSFRILCSSLLIRFFIPLLIFLGGPWTHVVDFNCKKITPHIHESLCKGLLIRGGKIYLKWH